VGGEPVKLIVCAGSRLKAGWVSHDVQGEVDIVCDLFDLSQHVSPASCEAIEFTHALEHFPASQTNRVLQLIHSLLVKDGELYIEVPNLTWHAEEILKDPRNKQIVEYMYGGQTDDYDYHYIGFTPELLEEYLAKNGFQVSNLNPVSTIECRAVKR